MVTKAERSLRGTWYSAAGTVTFKDDGANRYRGKRYFYAVSSGGMIQLSGNNSVNAILCQPFSDQLTLTENGKAIVYSRGR